MASQARINSLFFEDDDDDRISNESQKPKRRRKDPRMTSRSSTSRSGSDENSSLRTFRSKRRLCFDAVEEQPQSTSGAREIESGVTDCEAVPTVRLTAKENELVKLDAFRKPFRDLTNRGKNRGTGVTNPSRHVSLDKEARNGIRPGINKENEDSENVFKSNWNHRPKDVTHVKQNWKVNSECQTEKCLDILVDLGKTDLAQDIDDMLNTDRDDASLNGDYSSSCILPLVRNERQPELKTITAETLKDVLEGAHSQSLKKYTIIDCRYPYEYNGGHITDAVNVFKKEDLLAMFFNKKLEDEDEDLRGKEILIFHCEFSQERGPKMMSFTRNTDREMNKDSYPRLFYPEIYLLQGGYKSFYSCHPRHCTPEGYVAMKDKQHAADLSRFRVETKTRKSRKLKSTAKIQETSAMRKLFGRPLFDDCHGDEDAGM